MNKANRILENMDADVKDIIKENIGEISEKASVQKQAQYINELLNYAENNDIPMENAMRKCAGNCLTKDVIELARSIYEQAATMDEFLAGLNNAEIGGGRLHIENDKVIGIYKSCYCNIPYEIKGINPMYCQCSAGWFQLLFSEVLGKNVNVRIIDTITNGASECTFEIDCL